MDLKTILLAWRRALTLTITGFNPIYQRKQLAYIHQKYKSTYRIFLPINKCPFSNRIISTASSGEVVATNPYIKERVLS